MALPISPCRAELNTARQSDGRRGQWASNRPSWADHSIPSTKGELDVEPAVGCRLIVNERQRDRSTVGASIVLEWSQLATAAGASAASAAQQTCMSGLLVVGRLGGDEAEWITGGCSGAGRDVDESTRSQAKQSGQTEQHTQSSLIGTDAVTKRRSETSERRRSLTGVRLLRQRRLKSK